MVQLAGLVLVKMSKHHGELLESILGHSTLVPGLYLLLQVVSNAHAQLVELVPLLSQAHSGVFSVSVVQDQLLLQNLTQVLNLAEISGLTSNFMSLYKNLS